MTSNELFAAVNRDIKRTRVFGLVREIYDSAVQNANDTIYVEKAANPVDFQWLVVGSIRTLLSCSADFTPRFGAAEVTKAKKWFAARGVEA